MVDVHISIKPVLGITGDLGLKVSEFGANISSHTHYYRFRSGIRNWVNKMQRIMMMWLIGSNPKPNEL